MVSIGLTPSAGGVEKSVVCSGFQPGRGKGAARLAGDRLVDHLAVDCADALGVLREDRVGLVDRLGARRQRRVDRRYLRGMDGGLGGEAERHCGGDLVLQAGLVVQIEEWGVDRGYARQSTGRDEPAACESER